MKKLVKAIRDKFTIPKFNKITVYVFIRGDLANAGPLVYSYDKENLIDSVNKYKLKGEVFKRELSFFAHRHLKKTVSEMKINKCGDLILNGRTFR